MSVLDQASGLRRQALHDYPPSFAFFGADHCGQSTVAGELAAALALQRQRPLLIEHRNGQQLARRLGLPAAGTLGSVAVSLGDLNELMVGNRHGLTLINLAASVDERTRLSPRIWRRLINEFASVEQDAALLLLDTPSLSEDPGPCCIADNLVLVLTPSSDSLMGGYAQLKRLAQDYARRRFNVLVNRAANFDEAQAIFSRLQRVAGDYLPVGLRWVGFVPDDNTIRKSQTLRRPVVEAFPDSEAAHAYLQLAQMLPQWHAPDDDTPRGSYLEHLLMTSKALADLTGH